MKKLLLTAVLAVGALLTAASEGKAGFSITINGGGFGSTTLSDFTAPGTPDSPTIFGHGASLPAFGGSITVVTSAVHSPNRPTWLNTQVFLATTSGTITSDITITVTQDAYDFPTIPLDSYVGSISTSVLSGSQVFDATANTSGQSPQLLNGPSDSFSVAASPTPVSGSMEHVITIYASQANPIPASSNLTFTVRSEIVPTPVPATAIGMIAGLPLLGFAGYVRRRFTAAA